GFHGVCRQTIPAGAVRTLHREYPFAWLGILARTPPASDELIYASHERGFALHSMRTPEISRLYLQVSPQDEIADWPEDRIWSELHARLESEEGGIPDPGPLLDVSITPMRSFVVEPMRYGRLFLAGDAAHIVPPTGAKGLNLAVADVAVLAEALTDFYRTGSTAGLDAYSDRCLRRVWRVQHVSLWITLKVDRVPDRE